MIDENTYNALLKQVDDLKTQNERLADHVETHHRYFEELHELAGKALKQGGFGPGYNGFARRVYQLTHPNAGERG